MVTRRVIQQMPVVMHCLIQSNSGEYGSPAPIGYVYIVHPGAVRTVPRSPSISSVSWRQADICHCRFCLPDTSEEEPCLLSVRECGHRRDTEYRRRATDAALRIGRPAEHPPTPPAVSPHHCARSCLNNGIPAHTRPEKESTNAITIKRCFLIPLYTIRFIFQK